MDLPHLLRRSTLTATAAGCTVLLATQSASAHPHVWVGTKSAFVFENGALTGLRYTWLFDEMYSASAVEGLDKNNDGKLDAAELEELTKVNIEGLKEFDYFTTARAGAEAVTFDNPKNYSMELLEVDEGPGPQMVAGPSSSSSSSTSPPAPGPAASANEAAPPKGMWSRFSGWVSGLFGRSKSPSTTAAGTGTPAPSPAADKIKVLALHMTLPLKAPVPAGKLTAASQGFQFSLNDPQMFIWFEPMPKDGVSLSPEAPAGCAFAILDPELDEEQKKLAEAFGRAGSMAVSTPGRPVQLTCGGK